MFYLQFTQTEAGLCADVYVREYVCVCATPYVQLVLHKTCRCVRTKRDWMCSSNIAVRASAFLMEGVSHKNNKEIIANGKIMLPIHVITHRW